MTSFCHATFSACHAPTSGGVVVARVAKMALVEKMALVALVALVAKMALVAEKMTPMLCALKCVHFQTNDSEPKS
jgi:hypothetical protein